MSLEKTAVEQMRGSNNPENHWKDIKTERWVCHILSSETAANERVSNEIGQNGNNKRNRDLEGVEYKEQI